MRRIAHPYPPGQPFQKVTAIGRTHHVDAGTKNACDRPLVVPPGCLPRIEDVSISPLIDCSFLKDLQFIQRNITEQPPNAGPGKSSVHRCQLLLHVCSDVLCGFDPNSVANHAGPEDWPINTFPLTVLVPLHYSAGIVTPVKRRNANAIASETDGK